MLIKLILEARKAKTNWLQALLAVNEILLKVISGKTIIVILEQQLSQCYLTVELELHDIVATLK